MNTGSVRLPTESRYIWERTEDLRKAADWLRKGAHLTIGGLPGTGKSTFVRQLVSSDVRERLCLGSEFLMVLLDGREFSGLSHEQIWGAIFGALQNARVSGVSQICTKRNLRATGYGELRGLFRSLRDMKSVVIFDHCSSLCTVTGQCVCNDLLRLSKKRSLALVTVPTPLCSSNTCAGQDCDQLVPMWLPLLSPAQAGVFVSRALLSLDIGEDLKDDLQGRFVDWVGGNLSLLDSACDLTVKLVENYVDVVMFYYWPSWREKAQFRRETDASGKGWRDDPTFKRILYELCSLDVQPLYTRWWSVLDDREKMILLAIDELQRIDPLWPEEIKGLIAKGFVRRQGERYVIHPKLWHDHILEQPATSRVGPFSFDLRDIQTVYVHGERRELSPEQAGVFFRLCLQRDHMVPYTHLYADLHAPYGDVIEDRGYPLDRFSIKAIDFDIDELRRALRVGSDVIQRVPYSRDALYSMSDGYRLAVSPGRPEQLAVSGL